MNDNLEQIVNSNHQSTPKDEESYWDRCREYIRGCINPDNARLYGSFQERAALNITQFPKIQGSLLIRMGMVYPLMSYVTERMGISKDCSTDLWGMTINYHTWIAGYLAYLTEIQMGLSKYPLEFISNMIKKTHAWMQNNPER